MFTGIIKGVATVGKIKKLPGLITFSLSVPIAFTNILQTGASIAVDGVCLTVVSYEKDSITFDVMQETISLTTLGALKEKQLVNIERSFHNGDEIGGHIVSGHVHGKAEIIKIEQSANNQTNFIKAPKMLMKYILPKGFIALDGASLTVVEVDYTKRTFTISLIPETLRRTTFGIKSTGDFVNIEVDQQTRTIVDTVERILAKKSIKNNVF